MLRPAKPVAVGKKVKCPRCELVFVAGEDEDDEPRSKPSKKAKPAKKDVAPAKVKEPAKKKDDEDSETYGYIKEPEEDEEKKPKIEYAPDESIRDLRGPAIVKLTPPANKLQLVGMVGTAGWLILFVILLIPTVFPIKPDATKPQPVMSIGPGLGAVNPQGGGFGGFGGMMMGGGGASGSQGPKFEEEKPGFFEFYGYDLAIWFLILMVPMMLLCVYSAMVVAGGIKMQNLESRPFAIVGSVMAMFPMHTGGLQILTALIAGYIFGEMLEDRDFAAYIALALMSLEYLISLGVGIWCLVVLWDQTVIDGFEFDPE
ncbi:MAG: hypothetical protein U0840_06350 [Gemmataceae bacterium]